MVYKEWLGPFDHINRNDNIISHCIERLHLNLFEIQNYQSNEISKTKWLPRIFPFLFLLLIFLVFLNKIFFEKISKDKIDDGKHDCQPSTNQSPVLQKIILNCQKLEFVKYFWSNNFLSFIQMQLCLRILFLILVFP